MYQMGLNRKLNRLKDDLDKQASTIKGIQTSKELEAEIKELNWRLSYIK